MSIQSEITRITNKRDASFTAVEAKGVTVPSGSTIDDLPGLIAQIQQGGGSAVVVTEEPDENGGTIKNIDAVDISSDTVDAAHLLYGYTAHDRFGEAVTGSYVAPTYSSQAKTNIDPSTSSQTITPDTGYDGLSSVQINAMPSGSATAASSITATGATVSTGTNTLTLSKTVSNTPQVSAGYVASGTAGNSSVSLTASVTTKSANTIYPSTTDATIASGSYLTGTQTFKAVAVSNTLSAENIKKDVVITIGDSSDADRIMSVTGTFEGGTSKNVQVVQGTTRTNSSTLTAIGAELTVSKTGTYDIYYACFRTNTSSSYTWGTQLYIGGAAYGSENTTWSNNQQNTHLTNISLTTGQKLRVYGRETRGTSYYVYAPMLAIVES